jgi:hypothetical protein
MVSEIITSTPETDIRPLFTSLNSKEQTGWDWIYSDLSGDDLKSVINTVGQKYWKAASYDEKFNECYTLIGWSGVNLGVPPGDMAQLVIMTILRSGERYENRRLYDEFQLQKLMNEKYLLEMEDLVGPQ